MHERFVIGHIASVAVGYTEDLFDKPFAFGYVFNCPVSAARCFGLDIPGSDKRCETKQRNVQNGNYSRQRGPPVQLTIGEVAGVAADETLTAPTVTVAELITVAVLVGLQATAPFARATALVPACENASH